MKLKKLALVVAMLLLQYELVPLQYPVILKPKNAY
jgi:hypothetical protein